MRAGVGVGVGVRVRVRVRARVRVRVRVRVACVAKACAHLVFDSESDISPTTHACDGTGLCRSSSASSCLTLSPSESLATRRSCATPLVSLSLQRAHTHQVNVYNSSNETFLPERNGTTSEGVESISSERKGCPTTSTHMWMHMHKNVHVHAHVHVHVHVQVN